MAAEQGEIKIEAPVSKYFNTKKSPAAKGDQVKGVFLRTIAGTYKDKPTTNHVLQGEDGNDIILPNHAVLNNMMLRVKVGQTVRVVYHGKGEASRGRSAPEMYEVYASETRQTQIPTTPPAPLADPSAVILDKLTKAKKLTDDGFWAMAAAETSGVADAMRLVEKLKREGKVLYQDGFWTAV